MDPALPSRPTSSDSRDTDMPNPVNLDLTSYVPLGVLTALAPDGFKFPEGNDSWTEVEPGVFYWINVAIVTSKGALTPMEHGLDILMSQKWIRVFHGRDRTSPELLCLRIYVLPADVAQRDIPRDNKHYQRRWRSLLALPVDTSSNAWNGYEVKSDKRGTSASCCFQCQTPLTDESLFYIFNTIASPRPDRLAMGDDWTSESADQILGGLEHELGIKTKLYPYQRRSIASMMQRETAPNCSPDPRLEKFWSPTGSEYFFDRVTSQIYHQAAHYEEPRGGILAETMGYGKTLIVLGLIAATKEQIAKTPIEHIETKPFTNKVGARSLLGTTANHAIKHGLPWRQFFRDMAKQGVHYETCMKVLQTPPYYESVMLANRSTRKAPEVERILLTKTTLIVVPPNLYDQWRAEIRKHLAPDALDVLEIKDDDTNLGTAERLAQYDIILMDKRALSHSFRKEPLSKMHFLRLVIDEGGTFASTGTGHSNMTPVTAILTERRWLVSGTPSQGLVGVEVDLAANAADQSGSNGSAEDQDEALQRRKQQRSEDIKDLHRLGRIVSNLLQAQPWCNAIHSGDGASWNAYTAVGAHPSQGFYSASSVRAILQSLVVRHQIKDVEAELPPLTNKVVFMEPTLYDKASMDLFTFVLINNAITSERVDQDYLFHESNRKHLDSLILNLRRAPFFWSGFSHVDMQKSLDVARKYAEDHPDLNEADKALLSQALTIVPNIINDSVWQDISSSQEVVIGVQNLPQRIGAPLGIDDRAVYLINSFAELQWDKEPFTAITASRLLSTQKFCRDNAHLHDPLRGLEGAVDEIANTSEHSDRVLSGSAEKEDKDKKSKQPKNIPQLSDTQLTDKQFALHKSLGSISTRKNKKRKLQDLNLAAEGSTIAASDILLSCTVSAKFSYLLSRVVELHQSEKILIFYEGDYIAWYMAQGLELLGVPHFIYANKIGAKLRNKYMETFMQEDCEERVMLIDLRQGSHGLNITAASRIFFINPVWQVGTEAQAIKRAHRIGQTKPVHVETLILKDSIEQKIFERRRQMTSAEQANATGNPLDDNAVHEITKNLTFYGGYDEMTNTTDEARYALLTHKPLVFTQLAESQAREQATTDKKRAATEKKATRTETTSIGGQPLNSAVIQASSDLSGSSTVVVDSHLPKKAKKAVGFA